MIDLTDHLARHAPDLDSVWRDAVDSALAGIKPRAGHGTDAMATSHQAKGITTMNTVNGFAAIGGDALGPYPARWEEGVYWNGWLCPRFHIDTVRQIAADITAAQAGQADSDLTEWIIVSIDDDGVVTLHDGPDCDPEIIAPDADGWYPVGAWSWVWEEASQ